uniref:Ig-like domain-containing protein n=1 Tax=Urocitellus parryii TaxID=9999 RepID=A0A8D2GYL1_UROPR
MWSPPSFTLITSLKTLSLNTRVRGQQVEQSPSEGDSAAINCTYSDSTWDYFPWYKQEAGKGPRRIIDIRSNKEINQIQRFIVVLDKKAKHFSLNITATQPGDSAVYFCAARLVLQGSGSVLIFCLWTLSAQFS